MRLRSHLPVALCMLAVHALAADPQLVINELMYHPYEAWPASQPQPSTNDTEFVELYNAGTTSVSLINYRFDNGIDFAFTNGTLAPGHYLVVCEDRTAFTNAYPTVTNLVGAFSGSFNNGGERVTLSRLENGNWITEDTVEYLDDNDSDGTGRSLELIHPRLARLRNQYYGDWAASTTISGTPGRVNSRYLPAPLPVVGDVLHAPPLPPARSAIKVTARATGRDGDALTVTLDYRKDAISQGAWLSTNMYDHGGEGDLVAQDGTYTMYLPPAGSGMVMTEGEMLEFRIRATDGLGTRTFPATNRADVSAASYSYLVKFGEDPFIDCAFPNEYETLHILMTAVNKNSLDTRGYTSDVLLDATLVTASGRVIYNCGTRFRGGSSRATLPRNYRIDLPRGYDLDGQRKINMNHDNSLRQYIGMVVTDRATGGYAFSNSLARLYVNNERKNPAQGIFHRFETFGGTMMERIYGSEGSGNLYSADGDVRTGYLQYVGDNPSSYMGLYFIDENNPYTAWKEMADFSRDLSLPESQYPTVITNRMNVPQWGRLFAVQVALDNGEAGFLTPRGNNYGDELRLAVHPLTGQFDIFPWDYDDVIGSSGTLWGYNNSTAAPTIRKFLFNRPVLPYYVGGVYDVITDVMSQTNMSNLFDSMGSKMAGLKSSYLGIIQSQRAALTAQINTNLTVNGLAAAATVLMAPSTNVGALLTATGVNQNLSPARWTFLGSLNTSTTNAIVTVTRQTLSPVNMTLADAVMFSNSVAGSIVVDDGSPGFATQGSWQSSPNGGYAGGGYQYSSSAPSSATWPIVLPQSGTYSVYAWVFSPTNGTAESTRYDASSGSSAVIVNLQGTAPQNYTDLVTVNNQAVTTWNLRNNAWSMTNVVVLAGDVADVTVRALHPEGHVLQTRTFQVVGQRTPVIVQGTLSVNTDWRPEAGIYVVTNDLTVTAGTRLTVHPRSTVVFTPGRKLTVNGTLEILGTSAEPVRILPQGGTTPWLITASGASASLIVSNAVATQGRITATSGATLRILDSTVSGSQDTNGIVQTTGAANVEIARSTFRDFNRTRFESSPTLIDQSLFEHMTAVGIEFTGAAATATVSRTSLRQPLGTDAITFANATGGLVTNVLITGMTGTGVAVRASSVTVVNSLVDACGTALHVGGASTAASRNNTFVNNGVGVQGPFSLTNTIVWSPSVAAVLNGPATATTSDIELPANATYPGTGNLNRDPFFRNPMEQDYQLLPLSPAIGSGFGGVNMGASHPTGANPTAPANLNLAASSNSVLVSWTDLSPDETGFEIYRSLDNGLTWTLATTTPPDATQFSDPGLTPNVSYTYRLRAVHSRGASTFTDPASITIPLQNLTQLLVENLRITELHYNPPGAGDVSEFMELKNISTNLLLDLSGLYTDEARFVFTNGTTLAPQAFFVIAYNAAGFAAAYPGVTANGIYAPGAADLANSGETIAIRDALGTDIIRFAYDDNPVSWYPTTDGDGFSLVPVDPNPSSGDPNSPLYWRASSNLGGSPGTDDPAPFASGIVINEVLAHADNPLEDAIELHNIGAVPINIAGWYLSDVATNLTRYQIPTNSPQILQPGGYGVLYAGLTFQKDTNPDPFEITELGTEDVYLSAAQNGVLTGHRDIARFVGASENGVSFGRHARSDGQVDFVAMATRTFGMDNPSTLTQFRTGTGLPNSGPKVGPVVISEIMFNPGPGGKEYIELQNITAGAVPLFHPAFPTNAWKLRDAVSFTFPLGITLAAGERILVVGVPPAEFRQQLGIDPSIRIFGPVTGDLANGGESVELVKPEVPELDGFVPYVIVDRVVYDDAAPWPTAADNSGSSLERIDPNAYGNDPANWIANTIGGTPGRANNTSGIPSIGFLDLTGTSVETDAVINVQLTLQPANASTVTVSYALSGGTATPGADFTFAAGTVTFWPHETLKSFPLTIINDSIALGEDDETILIALTNASANAILGGNRVYTHTIVDNDATTLPPPAILPAKTTDFTNSIVIEMLPAVANSFIHYTLDGSIPTRDDLLYAGPFALHASARVTARSFLGSMNAGGSTSVLFRAQAIPAGWVPVSLPPNTIEVQIRNGSDDGYQPPGNLIPVNVSATNIIMPTTGSDYGSFFRFLAPNIPPGAQVTNAYVQFTAATNSIGTATINILGEATNTSATLLPQARNISNRLQTTNAVPWNIPVWTVGERGAAQRTPNLAAIIQEIAARPGWTTNNALGLIFRFTSTTAPRTVHSLEGNPEQAALLHVEWAEPLNQFFLTVLTNGSGTVSGGNLAVPAGSNATVSATALPDHTFTGWSGDVGDADTNAAILTVLMDQDRFVTANFAPLPPSAYFFTVTTNGSGTVIGGNRMVPAGSNDSATATADIGHAFAGWSGDVGAADTNAAMLTVVLDQDRTVTANFIELPPSTYFFTVLTNGQGVVLGGNETVPAGSNVSASAVADGGYAFAGWSGDVGNGDTNASILTVTMNQDRTVTASFVLIPPADPARFVGLGFPSSNTVTVTWQSDPSFVYTIYRTTNIVLDRPGETLATNIQGEVSGTNMYLDSGVAERAAFYFIESDYP